MHAPSNLLLVSDPEHGMKLAVFLARRLGEAAGRGELHRWIRTGQVRVNGGRVGAFDRVSTGDAVRLPPFAAALARPVPHAGDASLALPAVGTDLGAGLCVLAAEGDVLALSKPGGLPSQSGSGHTKSVASILREIFSGRAYAPAPAHRLDKDTSGLLLAGLSHQAQEALHALFARPDTAEATDAPGAAEETGIEKIYLAWVTGHWPHDREELLCDYVAKVTAGDGTQFETMRVVGSGPEEGGKPARSRVVPLAYRDGVPKGASLVRVTLETGRTHQIRVQLASRGFPVIGDRKYGGPPLGCMLLHAYALAFPWRGRKVRFTCLPGWAAAFAVDEHRLQLP